MKPVIYGPSDGAYLDQRTIVMSAAQLKWFLAAESFLRHVPQLRQVDIKAVCKRCKETDLRVRWDDVAQIYWVRCGCAHIEGRLPQTEIQRYETTELLHKLGWGLRCRTCGDWAQGGNDPLAQALSITCPCTRRVYQTPATPLVALAH